jgi:hypothetical protein
MAHLDQIPRCRPEAGHSSSLWNGRRWEVLVGFFVALGSLVTAAYAFIETFWG